MDQQNGLNETLENLVVELTKLPGIGRRSGERLAFHLMKRADSEVDALAKALAALKKTTFHCPQCYNLSDQESLCQLCQDSRRDRQQICVVEDPRDLVRIERTGHFQGLYHVLMGRIAPLDGVGPDDLTINDLFKRCQEQNIQEVILATSPDVDGDGTALYLQEQLKKRGIKVSRLARGVPTGSRLENISSSVLAEALSSRTSTE